MCVTEPRILRAVRFERFAESISYVLSTSGYSSTPPASTMYFRISYL